MREKKQLDIEGESIDASSFQNWAARVHTERLETTLRVPKREACGQASEQIKDTASLLAPPWLMLTDQSPIQDARAKRDVELAVSNRLDHLGCLLERRCKISIRNHGASFFYRNETRTHRI